MIERIRCIWLLFFVFVAQASASTKLYYIINNEAPSPSKNFRDVLQAFPKDRDPNPVLQFLEKLTKAQPTTEPNRDYDYDTYYKYDSPKCDDLNLLSILKDTMLRRQERVKKKLCCLANRCSKCPNRHRCSTCPSTQNVTSTTVHPKGGGGKGADGKGAGGNGSDGKGTGGNGSGGKGTDGKGSGGKGPGGKGSGGKGSGGKGSGGKGSDGKESGGKWSGGAWSGEGVATTLPPTTTTEMYLSPSIENFNPLASYEYSYTGNFEPMRKNNEVLDNRKFSIDYLDLNGWLRKRKPSEMENSQENKPHFIHKLLQKDLILKLLEKAKRFKEKSENDVDLRKKHGSDSRESSEESTVKAFKKRKRSKKRKGKKEGKRFQVMNNKHNKNKKKKYYKKKHEESDSISLSDIRESKESRSASEEVKRNKKKNKPARKESYEISADTSIDKNIDESADKNSDESINDSIYKNLDKSSEQSKEGSRQSHESSKLHADSNSVSVDVVTKKVKKKIVPKKLQKLKHPSEHYIQGGKIYNAQDFRKRLPQFMPKRYHWNVDEFNRLGYFWFNGPQGSNPGPWRIGYKK